MKKRLVLALAGIAVSTIALAGCSSTSSTSSAGSGTTSSSTASSAPTATGGDLSTASTSLGTIVVNGQGRSVYVYTKDTQNSGVSTCYDQCAGVWPAVVTTSATPVVQGVTGTVATIKRTDGTMQVTVNGWPLYTFASDTAAGDVAGQGVMNIWFVMTPAGQQVTAAPTTAPSSSSSGDSSGSSAGGGWS
jgi:predicted lipoprotein with Yx(FWY)xxD motif